MFFSFSHSLTHSPSLSPLFFRAIVFPFFWFETSMLLLLCCSNMYIYPLVAHKLAHSNNTHTHKQHDTTDMAYDLRQAHTNWHQLSHAIQMGWSLYLLFIASHGKFMVYHRFYYLTERWAIENEWGIRINRTNEMYWPSVEWIQQKKKDANVRQPNCSRSRKINDALLPFYFTF